MSGDSPPRRAWKTLGLAGDVLAARFLGRYHPLSLGWEVTAQCNATCTYCAFRDAADGELDTVEALRLIGEMAALGTRVVSLSGGEPLVRRDLGTLVDALCERDIEVSINTNGFLVERRRQILERMRCVKISVDGPEAIHDAVRGPGSWRRATSAVDRCQEWGLSVVVQTVLGRANVEHIDAHLAWCAERGLPVQVQPADPLVLHSQAPNPEAPEPVALRQAIASILDRRPPVVLNTRVGLEHMLAWPDPAPMTCASGKISARITSTGILRLCGRPPTEAPEASWRELGLADAFRRLYAVPCTQCWCAPRIDLNLAYQGRGLVKFVRGKATGVVPGLTRDPRARLAPREGT